MIYNGKKTRCFFLILSAALTLSFSLTQAQPATQEYARTEQGNALGSVNQVKMFALSDVGAKVYYGATNSIFQGSDASLAVIGIHGYDGGVHPDYTHHLLLETLEDCYVITPLFPSVRNMGKFPDEADGRALWSRSWMDEKVAGLPDDDWRGGGDAEGTALSSFDVIDRMIEILSDSRLYPNLKRIVVAGFSAGGQFVNRYAAVGKAKARKGIEMDYVSMSPSTNLYLDKDVIWHYGLASRPRYCRNMSERAIYRNLSHRRVLHACGALDTDQAGVDMTDAAMKQGINRLNRFNNYREYVSDFPGWKRHTLYYVLDSISHEPGKAYRDPVISRFIQTGEFQEPVVSR